jgi:hypothetical protein
MYPYMNEDVAWQRLQDLQREMENSRRLATGFWLISILRFGKRAAAAAWQLPGALLSGARTSEPAVEEYASESDVA